MRAAHHLQFQTDSPSPTPRPQIKYQPQSTYIILYIVYTAEVDNLTVFFKKFFREKDYLQPYNSAIKYKTNK